MPIPYFQNARRLMFGIGWGLLLAGCQSESRETTPPDPTIQPHIVLIGAGPGDEIWPILKANAQQYLYHHPTVNLRILEPPDEAATQQIALLNSLHGTAARACCIYSTRGHLLKTSLEQLRQKGIALVSLVHPLPVDVVGHFGMDDFAIGTQLAIATAKALGDNGTIMLLHAGSENAAYNQRLMGFEREIAFHGGIDVLARIDCGGDPIQARTAIRERSVRYPRLKAWVALDDWPLRNQSDPESIFPTEAQFITFGGKPSHWPLIRSGRCPALVTLDYAQLASKALTLTRMASQYPSVSATTYHAPLRLLTRECLEEETKIWRRYANSRPGE